VLTLAGHLSHLSQLIPVRNMPSNFFMIHFNIIFLSLGFSSGIYHLDFSPETPLASRSSPHTCYIPYPPHSFYLVSLVTVKSKNIKASNYATLSAQPHLLLGPIISRSLYFTFLRAYFFHKVSDQRKYGVARSCFEFHLHFIPHARNFDALALFPNV
jgi:hypothetical protein